MNNKNLYISKAYKYPNNYLTILEVDDGWDYSFYTSEYKLIDGGVYDDPNIDYEDALNIIEDENNLSGLTKTEIDYDEFMNIIES